MLPPPTGPIAGPANPLRRLARSGTATIGDIEKVVRSYSLYADQDRPPGEDPSPARNVRITRDDRGTGQITVTLSDVEIEEFAAALQAFIDLRYRPGAVDESSAEDSREHFRFPGCGYRHYDIEGRRTTLRGTIGA